MIRRFHPGGRLSQVVVSNGLAFLAGQVADDEKAGIEKQTRDVLSKIDQLLAEVGSSKSRLLMVNIYLQHITDFDAMNSVYDAWIDPQNLAARACVEARLADSDLRSEINTIKNA